MNKVKKIVECSECGTLMKESDSWNLYLDLWVCNSCDLKNPKCHSCFTPMKKGDCWYFYNDDLWFCDDSECQDELKETLKDDAFENGIIRSVDFDEIDGGAHE